MNWSNQQNSALTNISKWVSNPTEQVFRMFGYAGTGKTTLAKHIAEGVDGRVVFAAYTGKAAHVLQQKGCKNATTIHRMIYKPGNKSTLKLNKLKRQLTDIDPEDEVKIDKIKYEINEENERLKQPSFELYKESAIKGAKLIIIDECSMVDKRIGEDLLSFGIPILVLGDPGQLPPVYGSGFFTDHKPNIMLTDIHRQARDNPIINLATNVREGRQLSAGNYGDSKIISRKPTPHEVLEVDQIIVGRNKTKRGTNYKYRKLKSIDNVLPVEGDKLVCLRNDHEIGLLNGELWSVTSPLGCMDEKISMILSNGNYELCVDAHIHHFLGRAEELAYWQKLDAQEFDYGYALTCHKAQGSQWDNLMVLDESSCFGKDKNKWLYTAITRAAEKITIVI